MLCHAMECNSVTQIWSAGSADFAEGFQSVVTHCDVIFCHHCECQAKARRSPFWVQLLLPILSFLLLGTLQRRETQAKCSKVMQRMAKFSHLAIVLPVPFLVWHCQGTLVAFCFKLASGYPYFISGPVHGKDIVTDSDHETSSFLSWFVVTETNGIH